MGTVPVRDLPVGVLLAEDVVDRSGRVLLRRGSAIEQRHLRILAMWGVTEVAIEGDAGAQQPPEAPVEDDIRMAAERQTAAIFAHTNRDHPAMVELARLSTARLLGIGLEDAHGS
jgi:hypothetical protein